MLEKNHFKCLIPSFVSAKNKNGNRIQRKESTEPMSEIMEFCSNFVTIIVIVINLVCKDTSLSHHGQITHTPCVPTQTLLELKHWPAGSWKKCHVLQIVKCVINYEDPLSLPQCQHVSTYLFTHMDSDTHTCTIKWFSCYRTFRTNLT